MALTYLSLGSNVGDRAGNLREALTRLGGAGVEVLAVSGTLETAPYGVTDQPAFLNCAAKCSTNLTPPELIEAALGVERDMGRVRERRWGPRNIDIDIVFYDGLVLDLPGLKLPHYDMHNREFVLAPLCELEPGFRHPALGLTLAELLARLKAGEPPRPDK